jgi:hypothetical protein
MGWSEKPGEVALAAAVVVALAAYAKTVPMISRVLGDVAPRSGNSPAMTMVLNLLRAGLSAWGIVVVVLIAMSIAPHGGILWDRTAGAFALGAGGLVGTTWLQRACRRAANR